MAFWCQINLRIFSGGLGSEAQWQSYPPDEQKIRVPIPPGCKFLGKHCNAVVYIHDLMCIFLGTFLSVANGHVVHANTFAPKCRFIELAPGRSRTCFPCPSSTSSARPASSARVNQTLINRKFLSNQLFYLLRLGFT
jgi:hypothetical protein